MTNKKEFGIFRTYGVMPFSVALIHGGPGAGGEMAPVARELAANWGILEPIQSATSLNGQVDELREVLESHGRIPLSLVGYSWGAWLSLILAARFPRIVNKLILVGSGPFEERYVENLQETRLSRLNAEERAEFSSILDLLNSHQTENKDGLLSRLGTLVSKTDLIDPDMADSNVADQIGAKGEIFQGVWSEASEMRRTGRLLQLATKISCPLVAIHGADDPHPAEGVEKPLSREVEDFRFYLLDHCGHTPWLERRARDEFYRILREEIGCAT